MEEVEILCDRIIIIDNGKIIAQGTKEDLKSIVNIDEKITIELENQIEHEKISGLEKLENVDKVILDGNNLVITFKKGTHNFSHLLDYIKREDIQYSKINSQTPSLNDVFLELTGKELRDI